MTQIDVKAIDALLPQTQCTKCGYPDCLAYAKAIAKGEQHNQCPPGGDEGIAKLSALLNRPILPLNPNNGQHVPKVKAVIREAECIGCTKCIQACPVDAIMGAAKRMHTVIESECTGCDLCVEPCPMDCIDLVELNPEQQPENMTPSHQKTQANAYRTRHYNRDARLSTLRAERLAKHDKNKNAKSAYIEAALARLKAKKAM